MQETHTNDSPHNHVVKKEFHENLLKAIDNLPEQSRIVFMMSRLDDLSYKEIAGRLNISIKNS